MKYLLTILIVLTASPLFAGNRYSSGCSTCAPAYRAPVYQAQAVVERVVYPQTIIENQSVFYTVGEQVRQYAVSPQAVQAAQIGQLRREIQRGMDHLEELQSQQQTYSQQQALCYVAVPCVPGQQPMQPGYGQQQPQQPEQPRFSQEQRPSVMTVCLKCHGQNGKQRDHLDLTHALTCEDRENALEAVAIGEMPKGGRAFNREELKQLKLELRGWNQAHGWADEDRGDDRDRERAPTEDKPPRPPRVKPRPPQAPPKPNNDLPAPVPPAPNNDLPPETPPAPNNDLPAPAPAAAPTDQGRAEFQRRLMVSLFPDPKRGR